MGRSDAAQFHTQTTAADSQTRIEVCFSHALIKSKSFIKLIPATLCINTMPPAEWLLDSQRRCPLPEMLWLLWNHKPASPRHQLEQHQW